MSLTILDTAGVKKEILVPKKITKLCFWFEIFWRKNIGAKCC
jgi:hypothetical protein